jgi:hypothetical protein
LVDFFKDAINRQLIGYAKILSKIMSKSSYFVFLLRVFEMFFEPQQGKELTMAQTVGCLSLKRRSNQKILFT